MYYPRPAAEMGERGSSMTPLPVRTRFSPGERNV